METIKILRELGFIIHSEKEVVITKQDFTFLGFIISSELMILSLTDGKIYKIKNLWKNILSKDIVSIKELAKLIGNLVASSPAVVFELSHCRYLEMTKIEAHRLYRE